MNYVDSHCHFNSPELRSITEEGLTRASAAGVTRMAIVGTTLEDSEEAVEICRNFPGFGLFPTVGIHPHEAKDYGRTVPERLIELARLPEVHAWGEIGLDYYYDLSQRDEQIDMLALQLEAAKEISKPVVFHVRDGYGDFWPLMTPERVPDKAELHCFSGSMDDVKKGLDLGWKFGFTGVVTFKKADDVRDIVRFLPLESILCETDSPYMSPVPFRGKVNEPSRVPLIYQKVAEVKNLPLEQVVEQLWHNNVEFFGLEDMEEKDV